MPISGAHGDGVYSLVEAALGRLKVAPPDPSPAELPETLSDDGMPSQGLRVAIVGRPNVGKSTLVNALLGEERVIAFDMPGTTRDAIEIPFERHGIGYRLIDTAGLRRKGRVFEAVEKFSVIKTLHAIENAHVVVRCSMPDKTFLIKTPTSLALLPSRAGRWWWGSTSGMVLILLPATR
jgi:GTP-binding conserved hypothetical protein